MRREQANKGALGDNRGNYLDVLCDEIIIFGAKSYVVKGLQRLGSLTHRPIDGIGRIQPKEVIWYLFEVPAMTIKWESQVDTPTNRWIRKDSTEKK